MLLRGMYKKLTMGDNILKLSGLRYLPRWSVLLIDILILCISLSASYYILYKIKEFPVFVPLQYMLVIIIALNVIFMYFFRTYSGIIRHSSFIDLQKIFWSSTITLVILLSFKYFFLWILDVRLVYTPLLLLYYVVSFTALLVFRIVVKQAFFFLMQLKKSSEKKRLLVLGISNYSVSIANAILDNHNLPYEMVGFITKRNDSKYAKLLGKTIYTQDFLLRKNKDVLGIDAVLVIKDVLETDELDEWVNVFLEKDIEIFQAPIIEELNINKLESDIRNLQIEDLLNRNPIKIENEEILYRHKGKTILVTGGAGSIGSEIVRQVARLQPSLIVVLDQAETPMHEMELEMKAQFPFVNFKFLLGDISNYRRLEPVFQKYDFSIIYHAAAYKHVPMLEKNPHEAVLVNVLGTKYLALLSSKYKVGRFVMISTDKAVNPSNVMGASKRAAELLVQSLQNLPENTTKFITTRFGNVLGSNGSVIPLFKKQIQNGGPITITHPDIVRYFMTIPEACELVLQAGTMGEGGEIYVFDMGEPIKIIDLAKKMIKLSGLEIDKDIKISITGLRPGEKLYEELLSDNTKTIPTHNEKIMISKDPSMDFSEIDALINKMVKSALRHDDDEIVLCFKQIVPEYKSNNSDFERLDK